MSDSMPSILETWRQCITRIRTAADHRNYGLFRIAFRDGCRCFNQLKAELESERRQTCIDLHRNAILTTTEAWLGLTSELKVWMEEIRREAVNLRHENNIDRKISGTYGYIRKTGNALRLNR